MVPDDRRRAYDMRRVVRRMVDDDKFLELRPKMAQSVLTGFARMGGWSVGIIASQPMRSGGALTPEACDKMTRFLCLCDAFNVPVISLADSPGFLVGTRVEQDRLLFKAMLVAQALVRMRVPRITVVVRKAFGLSFFALSGTGTGAVALYAWPAAEIGFMDPDVAANVLYAGGTGGPRSGGALGRAATARADPGSRDQPLRRGRAHGRRRDPRSGRDRDRAPGPAGPARGHERAPVRAGRAQFLAHVLVIRRAAPADNFKSTLLNQPTGGLAGGDTVTASDAGRGGEPRARVSPAADVVSVLGPVAAQTLGFTLMHEHVVLRTPGFAENYPSTYPRESVIERAAADLSQLRAKGVATIVDLTTVDLGRDAGALAEVARRSGMTIVAATGSYHHVPTYFKPRTAERISRCSSVTWNRG